MHRLLDEACMQELCYSEKQCIKTMSSTCYNAGKLWTGSASGQRIVPRTTVHRIDSVSFTSHWERETSMHAHHAHHVAEIKVLGYLVDYGWGNYLGSLNRSAKKELRLTLTLTTTIYTMRMRCTPSPSKVSIFWSMLGWLLWWFCLFWKKGMPIQVYIVDI